MLVKHSVVTVTLDFCWVISMAALFAIRRRRRMQTERGRKIPLTQLTELEIIQNYRLSKAAILKLCSLLQHDLQRKNHGWRILTVEEQVLISLKVLAPEVFKILER